MQRLDPNQKGKAVLVAIRLPPELDEWVRMQCKGISKSEFIRSCIEDAKLQQHWAAKAK